jgi:general stress protein 26
VAKLVNVAGAGMLSAYQPGSGITSRPMMPLLMDGGGTLWFFTTKTSEEKQSNEVSLTFSDAEHGAYVALRGSSALVEDRAKVEALWSPIMRAWFPKGKEDPTLCLLRVDVAAGEYWNSSDWSVIRFGAMVASAIAGKPIGMGEHATVVNK